jgi:hypothetical protein
MRYHLSASFMQFNFNGRHPDNITSSEKVNTFFHSATTQHFASIYVGREN